MTKAQRLLIRLKARKLLAKGNADPRSLIRQNMARRKAKELTARRHVA